jgi:hypothetical protein
LIVARTALHPIAGELVSAALNNPSDLYIAHYSAALPAAAIAARRFDAKYAFDAEDFHPGEWTLDQLGLESQLVRRIENEYLPGCCYVTAASPGIADAYAALYGIPRPVVVLNTFPLRQAPLSPSLAGMVAPGPSIYWFSQTIGPDRGLECAIRALGLAQSQPHLYMRGKPARGYVETLRRLASENGVSGRIHFLPPELPDRMEKLASMFDVGFVGETGHSINRQIALTNKIFTYLLAGLPTLLSDIPAHRELAKELGRATRLYAVDNTEDLATNIDALLGDASALADGRALAYRLGQKKYNWEAVKLDLVECVGRHLGARPV